MAIKKLINEQNNNKIIVKYLPSADRAQISGNSNSIISSISSGNDIISIYKILEVKTVM